MYLHPVSKKEYVGQEGELLNPAQEGLAEIEEHTGRLGTYGYPARQCSRVARSSKGLYFERCLRFAEWIAPPPRKTRFRMAGLPFRAGPCYGAAYSELAPIA